jgi:hypothetical protein
MSKALDLTKTPPRSPRVRVGGYAILGRTADKGRAVLNGTAGEYDFDCPLDNMLFGFKGVAGAEIKPLLASGASDEEIAAWLDRHGHVKTTAEVAAWANFAERFRPYDHADQREWFTGACQGVGLDPAKTTLFEYLEADDRLTFAKT